MPAVESAIRHLEDCTSWLKDHFVGNNTFQSNLRDSEQQFWRLNRLVGLAITNAQKARVRSCGNKLRHMRKRFRMQFMNNARQVLPRTTRLSIAAFIRSRR